MGHLVDLPQKQLSVDIKDGFKPNYEVIPDKTKILESIRKSVKNATEIYLASDPDREGEAIAYHIARLLGIVDTAHRILFNEITKNAIKREVENPTKINLNKVYAQQARRILDRLVGYKVSPILWKLIHKGLSAGRVQSVALKILAKREDEIEKFVPSEYWTLDLTLSKDDATFPAKVTKFRGEKFELPDESHANKHRLAVEDAAPFTVKSVTRKEQKRIPPPPFITSTMQLETSRKLRYSAKKTMRIAQQLYEGIELGDEGPSGLITYMRTDSVRIADVARASAKKFIAAQFGKEYIGAIRHAKGKAAQDAHEAIRPTFPARTPQQVKQFLSADQFKLYELIWKRFIASQMAPAQLQRTAVALEAGEYTAETSETKIMFDGFLKVWSIRVAQSEEEEKVKLPPLEKDDIAALEKVEQNQHFTKPPARYSEGTLVRELEAQGIGRPSTYAQIISTLLMRKYTRSEKRKLIVTDLGKQVNMLLQKLFPDLFEEKFTAQMEQELDGIEQGKKEWQQVLNEFYSPFAQKLETVEKERKKLKEELTEKTGRKCPKCSSELVVRWGRYGKFIACSNYPKCRYTEPLEKDKRETQSLDEKCPECGAQLLIKYNRWGGKFVACSQYPKCKYARSYILDIPCPRKDCDGKLAELVSKKRKIFYACSREDCDFVAFYPPIAEPCPECGAKSTFMKKLKKAEIQFCALCDWKEQK